MGAEDNEPNFEELARRLEALERENRELREALGSDASHRQLETPQQPQATPPKQKALVSPNTVGGLLGSRDERAYFRPLARILPSYVVGLLLTCSVGAFATYIALFVTAMPHSEGIGWLGFAPVAALFFRPLWRYQRWQQVCLCAFPIRGAHYGDRDNGGGVVNVSNIVGLVLLFRERPS